MRSSIASFLVVIMFFLIALPVANANAKSYFKKMIDRTEKVYPEGIRFSKREMTLQDTPDRSHQIKFHQFSSTGNSVFKSWIISIEKAENPK